LSLLGHTDDHQQLNPAIAELQTGCEKVSRKFAALQVGEGIREELSPRSGSDNQEYEPSPMDVPQESSLLDSSIHDQTQLLLNNTVISPHEESKNDTTVKKNMNNSLLLDQITPIKEEGYADNES